MQSATPAPLSQFPIIPHERLEAFVAANTDQINQESTLKLVVLLVHSPAMQAVLETTIMALRQHDFMAAAMPIVRLFMVVADCLIALCQEEVCHGQNWRKRLRHRARKQGYKIHAYDRRSLQMPNGTHVNVTTAWFRIRRRAGKRKPGPKQPGSACKGRHLGLELLGYFKHMCPMLAFKALSLGVLCPSMARASQVLKDDGICISQNKIRDLFATFDGLRDKERARLSCRSDETRRGSSTLHTY